MRETDGRWTRIRCMDVYITTKFFLGAMDETGNESSTKLFRKTKTRTNRNEYFTNR